METIIFVFTILGSYIFGLMSGVIMMKKTNNKSSDKFRKEMLDVQKQQLTRTRQNKTDYNSGPKIIDKKVDVSKSPYSQGNLNWTKDGDVFVHNPPVKKKRVYKKRKKAVTKD